jgi:hypothetical protein
MNCAVCETNNQMEFPAEITNPFPRPQECRQTGCTCFPKAFGLFGLRFRAVYRSERRVGPAKERYWVVTRLLLRTDR